MEDTKQWIFQQIYQIICSTNPYIIEEDGSIDINLVNMFYKFVVLLKPNVCYNITYAYRIFCYYLCYEYTIYLSPDIFFDYIKDIAFDVGYEVLQAPIASNSLFPEDILIQNDDEIGLFICLIGESDIDSFTETYATTWN